MLALCRRYKPYRFTQANTTNHIIAQNWFTELQKNWEREAATGWSSENNLSNGVEKSFRRSAAAALGEMGQPQAARSREERQQRQGKTTTEPTTKSNYTFLWLMDILTTWILHFSNLSIGAYPLCGLVILLGWVSILVNLSHIHSLSNQFQ